ncbi:hypothetical protein FQZ97_1082820 [compost metagenome]
MAHHLTQLFDQAARGDQEQLAGLGQLHRRAGTVDQGQAEHVFQAANTPAECRLGDKPLFRRLRKTAGGGQGDEVFQPFGFQVHRCSFRKTDRTALHVGRIQERSEQSAINAHTNRHGALPAASDALRSSSAGGHTHIMPIVHTPAFNSIGRNRATTPNL